MYHDTLKEMQDRMSHYRMRQSTAKRMLDVLVPANSTAPNVPRPITSGAVSGNISLLF